MASGNVQQRIIQTGIQYDRYVAKEEVVTGYGEEVEGGIYEASAAPRSLV